VRQYFRLSELPLVPVNLDAAAGQFVQVRSLASNTITLGLTSIVVAVKNEGIS
jgi:hypothetical protein